MGAKGHGSAVGCVERLWKRFLSLTGPMGRRVRKLMGPVGPRVVVSPMGTTGWPGFRGLRSWTRPAGVRVDGPLARGLWPPNGGRLCSLALRGQGERFLGLTGLMAGGFLSLTGPLAPRVVVSPSWAMSIKSALRASPFFHIAKNLLDFRQPDSHQSADSG